MTSAINTNGINVNYPVPGINNSSQGFRDNFAAIRTDLNTAATEITNLQNNVVLKQALAGTTLNNDMANTLISNASTRGFRASTFNLGNAISGTLIINASLGDVQTGTINGNTNIQFTGWAPSGTQSNVELQLNVGNNLAVISLPTEVTINGTSGIETIENYANANGIPTLSMPYNVNRLNYRFSSLDCGDSITIEPYNQPRQSTQLQQRTPSPVGEQGDVAGTFSMDPASSIAFATCTAIDGTYNIITCDSTAGFYLDMPIAFTGITFGGILGGGTYYVRSIPSLTTFTVSTVPGTYAGPGQLSDLITATGTMYVSPINYLYASTGNYDATVIPKTASNTNIVTTTVTGTNTSATGNLITVSSTANFVVGYPVVFSGTINSVFATQTYASANTITVSDTSGMITGGRIVFTGAVFGGLSQAAYYITNIYSGNSNITVSTTFGGSNISLINFTGNCLASYNGIIGGLTDSANAEYYVQSVANSTTFTVTNTQGGAPVALLTENGSMNVTTVTDYTITLNSTSNVSTNSPVTFSGNVFGGISTDTIYYIANVTNGTDISISPTLYNGLSGQKLPLTTANGNMIVDISTGTEIWRSVPLKPFGSAEDGSAISGDLVVYGNATVLGSTSLANVTSNISTANILNVGNLSATGNISGNVLANNITISNSATITSPANLYIGGGVNGYVLQTDGTGNLSWTSQTGGGTGAPGGSNTQLQFNDGSVFGGSANLTFNKATNVLSVGNAISVLGNANIGNIGTGGLITATGNIQGANLVTGGVLSVTGNANIGNIGTAGLITATGNLNAGNIITSGIVSATGNGTFGNISTAGTLTVGTFLLTNLTATGNANFASIAGNGNVSLGTIANVKITGGTNGYILSTDGTGNLSWVVKPNSGSAVITATMSGATQANPGVITTTSAHNLPEKALVTITDVIGMTQLNGNSFYANVLTSNTFSLYSDVTLSTPVNTTAYGAYSSGGNITSTINGTGVGVAGGANTQIQFNNSGYVGGSSGFTFNSSSNVMNAPGSLTAAGTINGGNLTTGGTLSVTGNSNIGNIGTASLVATGNGTFSGNITTTSRLNSPSIVNGSSNIAITNGGNITLYVAGNATARLTATSTGATIAGTLSASGNANVGNIGATNGVFAGALSGITTITANGNVSTTSNLISSNYIVSGVTNGIIANGLSNTAATVLANGFNVVSTVSGTNNGVSLPAPISANSTVGMRVMVRNDGPVPLYVYPPVNAQINNLGNNIPYQQNATSTNEFFCTGNLVWYSLN
jgi:hypothetical protein